MSFLAAFFNRPTVRRVAWIVVVVAFVVGIVGGLNGGLKHRPDWGSFYGESCHVWQHRNIPAGTPMFGYLPTAFFALWPFTAWSPQPLGMIAFVLFNVLAAATSCWILYRWWFGGRDSAAAGAFVWPLFLTCGHLVHVVRANQLTIWVLLFCVIGLTLLAHRRPWLGGLSLGLAGCLKVLPFVLVPYLVLRRQWRALGGIAIAVLAFDLLPSILFLGVDGAVREHGAWLRRASWYSNRRMIEDPYLRIRRHGHNCAYSVVLARWLRPAPEARYQVILRGDPPADVIERTRASLEPDEVLVLDPMPVADRDWTRQRHEIPDLPRFRLAELSAKGVLAVWGTTLGLAVAVLSLATWRWGRHPAGGAGWAPEVCLWLLLMFWLTPMMRDYYLALAMPAYVVVWRAAASFSSPGARGVGGYIAVAALSLFFVGVLSLGWENANFYGIHLASLALLAAGCAWAWRVERSSRPAVVGTDDGA